MTPSSPPKQPMSISMMLWKLGAFPLGSILTLSFALLSGETLKSHNFTLAKILVVAWFLCLGFTFWHMTFVSFDLPSHQKLRLLPFIIPLVAAGPLMLLVALR
jgi:hypothetical protein